MTTDATLKDFNNLRAVAIAAAQDASGDIWTDYNLHDPGVTLLEQTVFGLTEVAYFGDHAVRDLLTGPDGDFALEQLALFSPAEVLPGRPVTWDDLASALSDLDHVDRVFVRAGPVRGLYDLVVIPDDTPDPGQRAARAGTAWRADLVSETRAWFSRNRLLTQDIHRISIAAARDVAVQGTLEITATADPARVVAEVIHQIRLMLRGLPADLRVKDRMAGATRGDVFDDVNRLRRTVAADMGDANRFAGILAAMRRITGLTKISGFALIDAVQGAPVTHKSQETDTYYEPLIPQPGDPVALHVMRDGSAVALDEDGVREELGRLRAARISQLGKRRNDADWDVARPGRHRMMDRAPLDTTLPAPYRRAQNRTANDGTSLGRYRAMMDGHLAAMTAPLRTLHDTYGLTAATDMTDPAAVRARVALLDYLIALQGVAMPAIDPAWMHHYRGAQARLAWQVRWRETYLAALPRYHRFSGTMHPEHGFGAHLAHLADMKTGGTDDLHPDPDQTLRIDAHMPAPAGTVARASLIAPSRPTDMLVTRMDDQAPMSLQKLCLSCPWIVDRATTPELARRATDPDAYLLARNADSDWEVLFQPASGAPLFPCGSNRSRAKAEIWANRLRLTFTRINRQAEHFWLIEDVQLRDASTDFSPAAAVLVLPSWTARNSLPGYRRYVADLVERLAPAHVHVQPLWLDWAAMAHLHPLIAAWQSGEAGGGRALRAALRDLQDQSAQ